jgi:hypothetical protein
VIFIISTARTIFCQSLSFFSLTATTELQAASKKSSGYSPKRSSKKAYCKKAPYAGYEKKTQQLANLSQNRTDRFAYNCFCHWLLYCLFPFFFTNIDCLPHGMELTAKR